MLGRRVFGGLGSWIAGSAAASLIVLGAGSAAAKNEFEHGFKDEAGRIAAHAAVGAGFAVLGGLLHGPAYYPVGGHGHHRPPYGHAYGYWGGPVAYGPPPVVHHYHEHHHYRHGHHGRGCNARHDDDHGYYAPRRERYESYERYERGGYGHARYGWED